MARRLLVQRKVDRGRVLMLGTTAHTGWSNLPVRKIFMPLVVRLTFDLAGAVDTRRQGNVAGRWPSTFPEKRDPSGSRSCRRAARSFACGLSPERPSRPAVPLYRDARAGRVRRATHRRGPPRAVALALNLDAEECDRPDETPTSFASGSPAPVLFADNPYDLSAVFAELREGTSLWTLFLSAVLVVLVLETFVANRLGPRPVDKPAGRDCGRN